MKLLNTGLSESLIKFLEYGIPGLSAIIILLAYFLLKTQNQKDNPSESMLKTIKSFMLIALILAIISGGFTTVEKYLQIKNKFEVLEKEAKNATSSLAVATANSMAKELAVLNRNHSYSGSTGTVGKGGGGGSGYPETINEPYISEQMTLEDFNYKKLKRAIFLSIKYCGANVKVLENAFSILSKRGYEIKRSSKSKLLNEFNDLIKLRYQWLENTAIPEGQKQLDDFPQQIQQKPYAMVRIPVELWLFSKYENGEEPLIRIDFGEIELYRNELNLLKKQLK